MSTNRRSQEWWDKHFLGMAEYVSRASKDPSTKVGAVIVDERRRVISTGYNGLPQNVPDDPEILENRDIKYKHVVHGEVNAILFSTQPLDGSTIYLWPFLCCVPCSSIIAQSGIKRVVARKNDIERWQEDLKMAKLNLHRANIEWVEYECE